MEEKNLREEIGRLERALKAYSLFQQEHNQQTKEMKTIATQHNFLMGILLSAIVFKLLFDLIISLFL